MAGDPTAEADRIAAEMRRYYEDNKPRGISGWLYARRAREMGTADGLMLGLLNVVLRETKGGDNGRR